MNRFETVMNFTSCEVSGVGRRISLSYSGDFGSAQQLHISAAQAGSLAMTLPRLLSVALQARLRDPSLRIVFPLAECDLDATAVSSNRILSLCTPDGFEVGFSISPETLAHIGAPIDIGADSHEMIH